MITMGMLRSVVTAAMVFAAACDVGSVLAHEGSGGADGGGSGSGSDPEACPAVTSPEIQTGHHAANGQTGDAGIVTAITPHEGCLGQAGCHNAALTPAVGDIWDYGGEAFQDAAGTIPFAGAHIMLTIGGSPPQTAVMEVMKNGFFYLPHGGGFPTPSATQPVSVAICVGTTKTQMSTSLAAVQTGSGTDGNCNGVACHGPGQAGLFIFMPPPP
jgi:hypothetical protein